MPLLNGDRIKTRQREKSACWRICYSVRLRNCLSAIAGFAHSLFRSFRFEPSRVTDGNEQCSNFDIPTVYRATNIANL